MRWNATITLLGNPERYQDDEGAWHEGEPSRRTVFCNEMKYASMFMGNLRSNDVRSLNNNLQVDTGQQPEVQIQVRQEDYRGEPMCVYKGREYYISFYDRAGEFSVLSLVGRLNTVGRTDG